MEESLGKTHHKIQSTNERLKVEDGSPRKRVAEAWRRRSKSKKEKTVKTPFLYHVDYVD